MACATPTLTLEELKMLLVSSIELNTRCGNVQPYDPEDRSVTCSVRLVEKDGLPLVVKYGTRVSPVEAEVTTFVSRHTSVRVPQVYAILCEDSGGHECDIPADLNEASPALITYIVEERLPGRTLKDAWSLLTYSERKTAAAELAAVFTQLAELVPDRFCLGPLRGPWRNAYFAPFQESFPCGELDARTPRTFLTYFGDIAAAAYGTPEAYEDACSAAALAPFDLARAAVFSHGDLQPDNVVVDEAGHVVGVIGWAAAGWYPYFWDSFVLLSSMTKHWNMHGWEKAAPTLCPWYEEEARGFRALWLSAMEAL